MTPAHTSVRRYWQHIGKRWTIMQPRFDQRIAPGVRLVEPSIRFAWWFHWRRS